MFLNAVLETNLTQKLKTMRKIEQIEDDELFNYPIPGELVVSDEIPSIDDEMAEMAELRKGLSPQQLLAFDYILTWIVSKGTLAGETSLQYKLTGYAGTGKSFLVGRILKALEILDIRLRICVVAPSHKAKRNSKKMVIKAGAGVSLHVEYRTLASFLGQAPELNKATGKEAFVSKKNPMELIGYDLVVVDEYAMIQKDNAKELLSESNEHLTLFLGDDAQLEPIGESVSYIAMADLPESKLTQVMRYSGKLAQVAESWIKKMGIPLAFTAEDYTIQKLPNKTAMMSHFAVAIRESLRTLNYESAVMVCYTNNACDIANSWVRELVFNTDEPYVIGDRLIAKKPLFRLSNEFNTSGQDKYSIACENSMEFSVTGNYRVAEITIEQTIYEYYIVPVKPDEPLPYYGETFDLFILHQNYAKLHRQHIERCKKNKHWPVMYDLIKTFDDIAFAYARTCHKCQGSTFSHVYLDLPDLYKVTKKPPMIYTALTRASEVVYVY